VVWGKDALGEKSHGRGTTRVRNDAAYLDAGGLLRFSPETPAEGWLEFPFEVKKKEPLRLILVLDARRGVEIPATAQRHQAARTA